MNSLNKSRESIHLTTKFNESKSMNIEVDEKRPFGNILINPLSFNKAPNPIWGELYTFQSNNKPINFVNNSRKIRLPP